METQKGDRVSYLVILSLLTLCSWAIYFLLSKNISDPGYFLASNKWIAFGIGFLVFPISISLLFLDEIIAEFYQSITSANKIKSKYIKPLLIATTVLSSGFLVFLIIPKPPRLSSLFDSFLLICFISLIIVISFIYFLFPVQKIFRYYPDRRDRDNKMIMRRTWINIAGMLLIQIIFILLIILNPINVYENIYLRVISFMVLVFVPEHFHWKIFGRKYVKCLTTMLLIQGVIYWAVKKLSNISNCSWCNGWSESSLILTAALFNSKGWFGTQTVLPIMNPNVALLMAIPSFLIKQLSIWFLRTWSVFLNLGITLTTAYLFVLRIKVTNKLLYWLFFSIMLIMAPVKFALLICPLIVLVGYDRNHFFRTLFFVCIASLWAGISRMNWFFVPGMLCAVMYVLEKPFEESFINYFWKPFVWVLAGTMSSIFSFFMYKSLAGYPLSDVFYAIKEEFIAYRLLPSVTYLPGVLPSLIILILPILFLIIEVFQRRVIHLHPLRLSIVCLFFITYLIGSIFISSKIGGGADIHNFDSFIVFVIIISGYIAGPQITPDTDSGFSWENFNSVLLPAVLLPCFSVFLLPITFWYRDEEKINTFLAMQQSIQSQSQKEPLFISQTQLITFNVIDNARPFPKHEKLILMEMALAQNASFSQQLYNDLAERKYSMIVVDPLFSEYKGVKISFGEENDRWLEYVANPILAFYEPIIDSRLNV